MGSAACLPLKRLFLRDAHLRVMDVSERAITHGLAGHLAPLSSGHHVDREYNGL